MGALSGVKILDFSTLLPGPYATMMLADLGAEVLKISSPDRYDLVTHWPPQIPGTDTCAAAAWLGRNKKTIHLNLKKPGAVEAVRRLIADYDVVVEQFRPGVMKKLGLDYETLRAINPKLIYCSLTGYGQTGSLADRAGHDINYLSRAGLMDAAGRKDGGPVLYNLQIADVAAGSMNTVVGILAALYARTQTGLGQAIDIAMLDGAAAFHGMDGASFLAGGSAPERESQMLNGGRIYDFYETADGAYMSVGSLEPKFFANLCHGLGYPEWADGALLETDPQKVKESFRAAFLQKTKAEWTEIFSSLDACVEPVLTMEEAKNDPQLRARQMWPEVPLPQNPGTTVTQMGCPIRLSETAPEYRHAGYPEGWHTAGILGAMGFSAEEIDEISS